MEKGDDYDEVIIHSKEFKLLKTDFQSLYKIIPAAGGLVLNEDDITIAGKIGISNHSYKNNGGKRLLKLAHWYLMNTYKQETVPQTEEDIVKAEWMTLEKFYSEERPVFSNILEILDLFQMKLSQQEDFEPYF